MSVLAIIPARGGSKRLPKKNLLPLAGSPLIAWTIDAALKSAHIDRVIVSSEDDEILKISENHGADILRRPESLASDSSTSIDVVKHVIRSIDTMYDYIVMLQATSPLRNAKHIDEAFDVLSSNHADAVISVAEVEHSPLWSNTLPDNDSMVNFIDKEIAKIRSQDLPVYYRLNGAIYICRTACLLEHGSFFIPKNIYAYKMSPADSLDIDTEIDFKLAEYLFK